MIQEPQTLVSDTHLERRTVHARRRAHGGDWPGAAQEYEAIWPHTKQLSPCRRLRFLSHYAEALLRTDPVMAFERLRALVAEAALLCYRQSFEHQSTHSIQRHVSKLVACLLQVSRDVGIDSAMGQRLLEGIWAIASALMGKTPESDLPELRAVQGKNGEILWLFRTPKQNEKQHLFQYHLVRPSSDGPAN